MALMQLPLLSGQQELIEQIKSVLLKGKNVVLLGEHASGRTVFAEKLLSALEDDSYAQAYLSCREVKKVDEALTLITKQLFLEKLWAKTDDGEDDTVEQVNLITCLKEETQDVLRVVFLDDVECASSFLLNEVINACCLGTTNGKLVVIASCLLGKQNDLLTLLADAKLNPLVVSMPKLTPNDCLLVYYAFMRYIQPQRFNVPTNSDSKEHFAPFDASYFKEGEWTLGKIKELVQVNSCDKMLSEKEPNNEPQSNLQMEDDMKEKKDNRNKLLLALGLSVTFLVAGLVYCVFIYVRFVSEEPNSSLTSSVENIVNTPSVTSKVEDDIVEQLPETLSNDTVVITQAKEKVSTKVIVDDKTLNVLENQMPDKDVDNSTLNQHIDTLNKDVVDNKQNIVSQPTDNIMTQEIVNSKQDEETVNASQIAKTDKNIFTKKAPAVSEIKTEITNQTKNNVSSKQTVNVNDENLGSGQDVVTLESELLGNEISGSKAIASSKFSSLDAKSYVVQIIASKSKVDAQNTADLIPAEFQTWVLKREGRKDYIAVVGSFKTYKEAQLAISKFPASVKNLGPWPKKVSAVRSDLK